MLDLTLNTNWRNCEIMPMCRGGVLIALRRRREYGDSVEPRPLGVSAVYALWSTACPGQAGVVSLLLAMLIGVLAPDALSQDPKRVGKSINDAASAAYKTKVCKTEILNCLPRCTKKMIEGDKEPDDGTFRVATSAAIKAHGNDDDIGALHDNGTILIPQAAFNGNWPAYKYSLGRYLIHEYQHVKNYNAGIGSVNLGKKDPYIVFR